MPDMRSHSQTDRFLAELFGGCAASDASAVLATGMFRDLCLAPRRALRILLADRAGKVSHEVLIQNHPALGGSFLTSSSYLRIGQRFFLRPNNRLRLDKNPLPLIPFARPRPADDAAAQRRALASPA